MQAPWNQWGNSVPSNTTGYVGPNYPNHPNPVPPAVGAYPLAATNPYPAPSAPSLNTAAPPSAVNSQFPSMQQQQWQQQQQWEQWQQQYAQWHQQYGDKYTGPSPTQLLPNTGGAPPNNFSSMPPLPQGAPSVQPPPPDSVPPPSDKIDDKKRSLQDSGGKEETKKQKTGKGSKSDNLEDLIEQEKTFDAQFKSWEASFLQWKDQNANHPDKTQYKEYEAKWENWREQLLQKREQLRKKRETKEAEVAAAAAAAKEAALATSSISTVQQAFTTNVVTQSNPYMPSGMMYPNYMSNYPMFNMPPPPGLPHMSVMPPLVPPPDSQMNMKNSSDGPPPNQSLEFLSSSTTRTNAKSIPGLDLVGGTDRGLPPPIMSTLPSSSSIFNYNHNQDVTKPLHTSDDKPFNFPQPPSQSNYANENHMHGPYSRGGDSGFGPGDNSNRNSRFPPYDDRFSRQNDSRFNNDFQYRSGGRGGASVSDNKNYRNESTDKFDKFGGGSSSFTPNFSSDKFAKYYEDEYDDSRFRDPEPENEPYDRFQGRNDYGQNSNSNYRQNYGRGPANDHSFTRNNEGSFKRNEFGGNNRGGFDKTRNDLKDNRGSFDRGWQSGNRDSKFGGGWNSQYGNDDNKQNFVRNDFKNTPGKFDNADSRSDSGRPVSLLDLPPMKPPDIPSNFDKNTSFSDNSESSTPVQQSEDKFKQFPNRNNRYTNFRNESDQNFHTEKEPTKSFVNSTSIKPPVTPSNLGNKEKIDKPPPPPPPSQKQIVDFVPEKIYEYDHISRSDENDLNRVFEPIHVFDYSHGKSKANNFINDLIASTSVPSGATSAHSVAETPNSNDHSGDNGSSNETNAKEMSKVALPQRIRPVNESAKESTDVFQDKPRNDVSNFKSIVDINAAPCAPSLSNRNESRKLDSYNNEFDIFADDEPTKGEIVSINDLLCPPGRQSRPKKLVIIMRGPPGSGKTYTAKLIKDKEVEMGGSAPRILSLDDYFMVENDVEVKDPVTGRVTTRKEMQYEYEAELETSYQESLIKSFKKTVSDGFFPFIIVDCVNDKLQKYEEMWSHAIMKGFKPFICEMDTNLAICKERNVHNRNEDEISQIINAWEKTPAPYTLVDIRSLQQPVAIREEDIVDISDDEETVENSKKNDDESVENTQENEVEQTKDDDDEKMEDEEATENDESKDETDVEADAKNEGLTSYMEVFCTSKWEKMENTEEKLDRLDGIAKKRSTSFKEWLQLPEESEGELSWYTSSADAKTSNSGDASVTRKKRVRWADLEERVAQQRMRAIGFVVGQTDWKRMMDPSCGGNALTKTKYIYN